MDRAESASRAKSGCCSSATSRVCRRAGDLSASRRRGFSVAVRLSWSGTRGTRGDSPAVAHAQRMIALETSGFHVGAWQRSLVARGRLVSASSAATVGSERGSIAEHLGLAGSRGASRSPTRRGVSLAKASGIETPTRAELARFDRPRTATSCLVAVSAGPLARRPTGEGGRTHFGIGGWDGAVTVQDASEGDSRLCRRTLKRMSGFRRRPAVQPAGVGNAQRRDAGGSRRGSGFAQHRRSRSAGRGGCWQGGTHDAGQTPAGCRAPAPKCGCRRTPRVFAATEAVVFNAVAGS